MTLWNPEQINTLFWYDPSDIRALSLSSYSGKQRVIRAKDKGTSKSYDLTPSTIVNAGPGPVHGGIKLNGLDVFEFNGENCLDNLDFTRNQAADNTLITFVASMSGSGDIDSLLSLRTNTSRPRLYLRRSFTELQWVFGSPSEEMIIFNQVSIAKYTPYIITVRLNGNTSQAFINSARGTSSADFILNSQEIQRIGLGHNEAEVIDFNGYFGDIVGYSSNDDRELVEGYLAWKWGMVSNLDNSNPYKTNNIFFNDISRRDDKYATNTEYGDERFRRLVSLGYV